MPDSAITRTATDRLLLCSPDLPLDADDLQREGWRLQAVPDLTTPVDPSAIGLLSCPDAASLAALAGSDRPFACPVLLLSPPPSAGVREALIGRGIVQWLPADTALPLKAAVLAWTGGLAVRFTAQEQLVRAQLDERKWTERAKGLLMQARGIDEAAAFALLRSTAMQTQSKLPDVARGVVRTAELAEALERAGAQRMLSQRMVKLQTLRQWPRLTLPERREAQSLLDASMARVAANLERLAELLREDLSAEQAAVASAWRQLQPALASRQPDLQRSDEAAQRLLESSELLVARLCERAGQRPVGLLAQVTRLRLLSQRLAKEGLLAQVVPGHDATGLAAGLDEFIQAYDAVRATPLASPALQPAFAAVDEAWLVLLRGLRVEPGEAVQRMHQGSERLLQALEDLIRALQGSLQLILG
ncbi:MAG: ANTAR domain-containing protein [Burkholderiales bacterium]|nr:MAG: ANTAR domain-containing protein [Burkholderiales bacterium]